MQKYILDLREIFSINWRFKQWTYKRLGRLRVRLGHWILAE